MEHLPVSKQAKFEATETIPYICQVEYDNGEFLTYPTRIEGLPALSAGDMSPGFLSNKHTRMVRSMSKAELEPILQTWLFFGLIHEVLGELCHPQDFIREIVAGEGHRRVLTTSSLAFFLDHWVNQVRSKTIHPHPSYDHLARCLRLSWAVLFAVPDSFGRAMKASLASLGEIIGFAINRAFEIEDFEQENKSPMVWNQLCDISGLRKQLLAAGWCPSQVEQLFIINPPNLQSLHFLTSLSQLDAIETHQRCDKHSCLAYQVKFDDYRVQHASEDCNCGGELFVDSSRLVDILSESPSSLPLLRINGSQNAQTLSIDVVASNENSQYVALSHVWADGLGNAHHNALARCQVSRLGELVKTLNVSAGEPTQELLLWCDTLCCPVELGHAKKLALSRMTMTYEKAAVVLVLTSPLLIHDSENLDYVEMWMMIQSSGWMRRVWTLQEAVLAGRDRRLWFQFKDKAVRSRTILKAIWDTSDSSVGRIGILSFAVAGMTKLFFRDLPECREIGVGLNHVDEALQGRSISYAQDEPFVIGTLLGLDTGKILDGPDETRVHRLWSLMPSAPRGIPIDVIFRVCPRLQEVGFRWAPATLLKTNKYFRLTRGRGQGRPGSDGLLAGLAGHRLLLPPQKKGSFLDPWSVEEDPNIQNTLNVRGEDGKWYYLSRRYPANEDSFLSNKTLRSLLRDAFMLPNCDMWIVRLTPFVNNKGLRNCVSSLILLVVKETRGIKFARRELFVNIMAEDKSIETLLELSFKVAKQLSGSLAAEGIAEFPTEDAAMDSATPVAVSKALWLKILSITKSDKFAKEMAEAGHESLDDSTMHLLHRYIINAFVGAYGILTDEVSDDQQWCVD